MIAALAVIALLSVLALYFRRWVTARVWRDRCEAQQGVHLCRRWLHHPGAHSTGWLPAPGAGRMCVRWTMRLVITRRLLPRP